MRPLAVRVMSLLALAVGSRAYAAEAGAAAESDREVGGHVFTPSHIIKSPFSTTAFGTSTHFGYGTTTAPRYNRDGVIVGTRDYDLAAFGQGFDFSARVTPALSLRLNLAFSAYSGLDGRGVLVAGVTAQGQASAGLTLGQRLTRGLRGALTFDAIASPEYDVLIARAIIKAIQEASLDEASLLEKGSRVRYVPGVSVGWAPVPSVGLVGNAQFIWSRLATGEGKKDVLGAAFGGALDLDLDPLVHAPIALLAQYRWEGLGDVTRLQDIGGGIFYSRRLHLALGLEFVRRALTIRPGVDPLKTKATIATIVLRYYW